MPGNHHVQQDQVGAAGGDRIERLETVVRQHELAPGAGQVGRKKLEVQLLVVNGEHTSHRGELQQGGFSPCGRGTVIPASCRGQPRSNTPS
jgi:hypothetical protein